MNKLWFSFLLLLLMVSLSACGSSSPDEGSKKGPGPQKKAEDQECTLNFEKEGLTATVTPIAINVGGWSSFSLKFWPSNSVKSGQPVDPGYTIIQRSFMHMYTPPSHPGIGGTIERTATSGEYLWSKVGFTMNSEKGIWYLLIKLQSPSGVIGDEAKCEVHVP